MIRWIRRKAAPAWSGMMISVLSVVWCCAAHAASTTLVSVSNSGEQRIGTGFSFDISGNGRYVAFASDLFSPIEGNTENPNGVFVRDLQTKTTTRVSLNNDGIGGNKSI